MVCDFKSNCISGDRFIKGDNRSKSLFVKTGELLGIIQQPEKTGAANANAPTILPELATTIEQPTAAARLPELTAKATKDIATPATTAGTNESITFAPVINIQGNADAGVAEQIVQQVKNQCQNLLAELGRLKASERRLSYE